ncbi:MAG: hypothetical protein HPY73_08665 [Methanomassiliicoccales archaeon]|nr:MAG: hypothetical protein HPY73_08665 [Methanomassiliicoccales archaeon]
MMADDFSAHAAEVTVDFRKEVLPDEIKSLIERLLSKIADDCVKEGTRLIGHIKCVAETGPDTFLACSVVSPDAKPRCSGGLDKPSKDLRLIINILQYGLPKEALVKIVEKEAPRAFGPDSKVEILDLSKKGERCEKPKLISID